MVRRTPCWRLVLPFILLFSVAQCAPQREPLDWPSVEALIGAEFPNVPSITTSELAGTLEKGEQPVVLLDVRKAQEFAVSHLGGAHSVGSPEDAASLIERVASGGLVVAYCSVGYRSAAMVAALRERGIENVVNLQGSIFAWANEGRPVYRNRMLVDEVHPYDAAWGELLRPDLRSALTP